MVGKRTLVDPQSVQEFSRLMKKCGVGEVAKSEMRNALRSLITTVNKDNVNGFADLVVADINSKQTPIPQIVPAIKAPRPTWKPIRGKPRRGETGEKIAETCRWHGMELRVEKTRETDGTVVWAGSVDGDVLERSPALGGGRVTVRNAIELKARERISR